jgi:hypothetical protein
MNESVESLKTLTRTQAIFALQELVNHVGIMAMNDSDWTTICDLIDAKVKFARDNQ